MKFAAAADAAAFASRPCRSLRMLGRCDVCGAVAAVSHPARWEVTPDLVGGADVHVVADGWPVGDPCGHARMRWEPVTVLPGSEPCGSTCRDAVGGCCSCSCGGTNHGASHRLRNSHLTPHV